MNPGIHEAPVAHPFSLPLHPRFPSLPLTLFLSPFNRTLSPLNRPLCFPHSLREAGQATFAGKPANPPCLKKNLKSQAMSPRDSTLVTSHLPAWEEALLNATVARHRQSGGIPRIPFHRSQAQSGAQRRGDRSLRVSWCGDCCPPVPMWTPVSAPLDQVLLSSLTKVDMH